MAKAYSYYLGMYHYEARSWQAWHRHMLMVFLAQLFLLGIRLKFKKTPILTLPMAQMLMATAILIQYDRNALIKQTLMVIEYHKKEFRCLAFTPKTTACYIEIQSCLTIFCGACKFSAVVLMNRMNLSE